MYRVKVLTSMGEQFLPALLDRELPDGSQVFRVPMNYNEFIGTDIVGSLKLLTVTPEETRERVIFEMPEELALVFASVLGRCEELELRVKELEKGRVNLEEQPTAPTAPAPTAPAPTAPAPTAPAPTAPAPTAPAPTAPAPTAPEGPKAPRKPPTSGRPQ